MNSHQNNAMTVEEQEHFEPSNHEAPEILEPNFIGTLKTNESKSGEEIIREALMWLPRDPDSKTSSRINEERPLDPNNDEENTANLARSTAANEIKANNKYENKEEEENEGNDNDDIIGNLIKEFNDLELAKPNMKPGNIKHMMKDAEKNPLDGVLDMNENENERPVEDKVKETDEMSSSSDESEEEEHGGLYAFLDPEPVKEPEDDEAKFKRIKD